MKNLISIFRCRFPAGLLVFLFPVAAMSQPVTEKVEQLDYALPIPRLYDLPKKVNETSGLIEYAGALWSFNDSGGKPELYKIDLLTGTIIQTVVVEGAQNRDWEDIAQDDEYIYIGDFGNNMGTRKDQQVFRVAKADITEDAVLSVRSEAISFSFADQKNFSIRNRSNDYDCESIISFGDVLVLFTKNWVNGRTRIYRLPKEPGTYSIQPESEFNSGGLVTAADYNTADSTLALLGYTFRIPFVYIIRDFDGYRIDPASAIRVNLVAMGKLQTEGICFTGGDKLAISAEDTREAPQAVYMISLEQLLTNENVK